MTCDVEVTVTDNGQTKSVTLANAVTYQDSLTPHVQQVTPKRGGTGGGVTITITGSGFGYVFHSEKNQYYGFLY